MKSGAQGVRRLLLAARYSYQGLKSGWRSEAAIRQELIVISFLIPLVFIHTLTNVERALLILTTLLVLIAELLNTSIEMVVDRIALHAIKLLHNFNLATPILVLIAWEHIETKTSALNVGAEDYVLKPCDARELETRLGKILLSKVFNRFSHD